MKPLIFFVSDPKDQCGKIPLTKEELEDMLMQAYEAGKKDGNIASVNPIQTPTTVPPSVWPYVPQIIWASELNTVPLESKVTTRGLGEET